MDDREAMRRWVETWKEAGPALEAIRRREIRDADNPQVLAALECAFNQALAALPSRPLPPGRYAGMVRQAPPMNDLFQTVAELQSFCDWHDWRSCCTGIAVQRW